MGHFQVQCTSCQSSFLADAQHSGQVVACPECQVHLQLPNFEVEAVAVQTQPSQLISNAKWAILECECCGKRLKVKRKKLGQETECPKCEQTVVLPTAEELKVIETRLKDGSFAKAIDRHKVALAHPKLLTRCPECQVKLSYSWRKIKRQGTCPKCSCEFEFPPPAFEEPKPEIAIAVQPDEEIPIAVEAVTEVVPPKVPLSEAVPPTTAHTLGNDPASLETPPVAAPTPEIELSADSNRTPFRTKTPQSEKSSGLFWVGLTASVLVLAGLLCGAYVYFIGFTFADRLVATGDQTVSSNDDSVGADQLQSGQTKPIKNDSDSSESSDNLDPEKTDLTSTENSTERSPDVFADFGSESSTAESPKLSLDSTDDESKSPEEISESPEAETPSSPPPDFDLKYEFGRFLELRGYQIDIDISCEGESEEVKGYLFFPNQEFETDSRPYKNPRGGSQNVPLVEYVTGLGLPGKQIVIPTELDLDAEEFEIIDQNQNSWKPTEVVRHKDAGVVVLKYDGPEFKKLPISSLEHRNQPVNVFRIDESGILDGWLEVPTKMLNSDRGYALSQKNGNNSGNIGLVESGVATTYWGTLRGILTRDHFLVPVFRFKDAIENSELAFEVKDGAVTMDPQETFDQMKLNLVQVVVRRNAPRERRSQKLKYTLHFDEPRKVVVGPQAWQLREIHQDTARVPLQAYSPRGGSTIKGSINSTKASMPVPGLMKLASELAFEHFEVGKSAWNKTDRLMFGYSSRFKELSILRITPTDAAWRENKHNITMRRNFSIESYDEATKIAIIKQVFSMEPNQAVAARYQGVEQIHFDTVSKKTLKSTITSEFTLPFEGADKTVKTVVRTTLMDSQDAATKYLAKSQLKQWGMTPRRRNSSDYEVGVVPYRKLSDFDVKDIVSDLESKSTKNVIEAFKTLNSIQPKPNSKISESLVASLVQKKSISASGYIDAYKLLPLRRRVYRNWISKTHLSDLLGADQSQLTAKVAVDLMNLYPPLSKKFDDQIVESLIVGVYNPLVSQVLRSKYPHLAEAFCLKHFESKIWYLNQLENYALLAEFGTEKSLPVLEKHLAMYSKPNKATGKVNEKDRRLVGVKKAIAAIKSR